MHQPTRVLSPAHLQVAHYLVLAQLDETAWANITSNINSLQPAMDKAVVARAAALRRSRAEEDAV